MTRAPSFFSTALVCLGLLRADTGVIIPTGKNAPDDSMLSVESMDVHILIDNGHAIVSLKEVFRNKTLRVLEGTYSLALPESAAVSDFAVWDDLTRIPGVILERKRAEELYRNIRNQALDPGLLESGEVSESNAPGEARHSSEFTVQIIPIPAFGYKRIEAEYRQNVPVTQLASDFIFPLKPTSGNATSIANLSVSVEIRSAQPLVSLENVSKVYPLKITAQTPQSISASFSQTNLNLSSDFEFKYSLSNEKLPKITAYRSASAAEPGYFEASALLQQAKTTGEPDQPARTVLVLMDTSLSMQWEKLERSFQALEAILRSLRPQDSFNVLVFNSEVSRFLPAPQTATTDRIAKALDFVRATKLCGGTNLDAAFKAAFAQSGPNSYIVLLSDGDMTEGTIAPARFAASFDQSWRSIAENRRPHIYAFAIGDDANVRFLRRLAQHSGVFAQVNSSEPLEFKLANFVHDVGLAPLNPVTLTIDPRANTTLVYKWPGETFPGARAAWVGEYTKPGVTQFTVTSRSGAAAETETARADLPVTATDHPYLPASWARARVDALLEKIDREGEDKATIDEIIRLSRKYHFVTPYTSFLAAPRALLRPRLIRPGDPVLRVRTDPAIVSVIALFPFGLTKPLRYLHQEDIWQTRFVAPDDLADGAYIVRLILRDREDHVFREQKTFVISSHPPIVRIHLDSPRVRAGGRLALRVEASQTTRSITAQLYGAEPLFLHWTEADKANTGILAVPSTLPPGRYSIHVTAEDIAHNVSHQEVPLEVLP
ncbi:MAG: VIT and VWA domain-containing protein [Bryobacteraceae bacterium]